MTQRITRPTATLSGHALNIAVEMALGFEVRTGRFPAAIYTDGVVEGCVRDFAATAPIDDILDGERICTEVAGDGWAALRNDCFCAATRAKTVIGATRREAALRCFVLHKLGVVVELPADLPLEQLERNELK